jgi:hypothetical protein
MRTDPEEAIERLLALLDLQGKVRLVTGANFWTTQADQTIGLRSMVLSDGRSASVVLTSAGLRVREASVIVGADRAERVAMRVRSTSLERITCLVLAPDLDLRI